MEELGCKPSKYGYTLVEIMVVLTIFAIILSLGIPSVKVIFNLSEKNELMTFKRDIIYARNSAVAGNHIYTLYTDVENNGYKITKQGSAPITVKEVYFSKGIIIKSNSFNSIIDFYPTGTTSKIGTIGLTNRKNQKIEITITMATGKINLYVDR